jgi:uncharacterized membrane protein
MLTISIIQLLAIFIIPLLIMKYYNFFLTKWFGTIGSAYVLGILVAAVLYLLNEVGVTISLNEDVGEIGSHVAIAVAIPLLLFSANLSEARKLSKTVLRSFISLVVSATLVSSIVYYLYAINLDRGAELSGMAIGLYTGGTPNLFAIGNYFGLNNSLVNSANLSDMLIGAVFYMFLLVAAKPFLSLYLRNKLDDIYLKEETNIDNFEDIHIDEFKITKKLSSRILLSFGMALFGALLGVLLWVVLGSEDGKMLGLLVPTLMITVTVLGIIGSFIKSVRETPHMNVVGQYLILVFSFALASGINFDEIQNALGSTLILYGTITVGVFIVHSIISKFMNIDVDCTIVTLTAGLYGPAFVPAITKQIDNDDLTAPGLITGSIGYAIGTFLGIALVYIYLM